MTDEVFLTTMDELICELSTLVARCDLRKPEIAAARVAAAVVIAASEGCDANEQINSIAEFAGNAVTRLTEPSQPEEARH